MTDSGHGDIMTGPSDGRNPRGDYLRLPTFMPYLSREILQDHITEHKMYIAQF